MATCSGCGEPIAPNKGPGRKRKWCSEVCRRRTSYTTPCKTCGKLVYDGTAKPPTECGECKHERIYGERNRQIEALAREELPNGLIAANLGLSEDEVRGRIQQARQEGIDLPLRKLGGDADEREVRHRRILDLRKQGVSNAEIAVIVGMSSKNCVNQAFQVMKKKGWEVPAWSEVMNDMNEARASLRRSAA